MGAVYIYIFFFKRKKSLLIISGLDVSSFETEECVFHSSHFSALSLVGKASVEAVGGFQCRQLLEGGWVSEGVGRSPGAPPQCRLGAANELLPHGLLSQVEAPQVKNQQALRCHRISEAEVGRMWSTCFCVDFSENSGAFPSLVFHK